MSQSLLLQLEFQLRVGLPPRSGNPLRGTASLSDDNIKKVNSSTSTRDNAIFKPKC